MKNPIHTPVDTLQAQSRHLWDARSIRLFWSTLFILGGAFMFGLACLLDRREFALVVSAMWIFAFVLIADSLRLRFKASRLDSIVSSRTGRRQTRGSRSEEFLRGVRGALGKRPS
ncbi:hypothetical protein [Cryobacterium zhongshanensis]|uniref:Uncharacterized protein n=1 Tax=Cryobacterium zhongshanensis TaxID=2928153 RepID=A0AA41R2Q8_9MICO|nr:hypothetical protein [Cryobacterium zhongshanensis]MCI4659746.1 hypothetical protein [Cryobacterium zhongshanensis]